MRATVELHEDSKGGLPPVKAKVTLGKEDLSVKVNQILINAGPPRAKHVVMFKRCFTCLPQISDSGGGVPLRKIERLFNYMYSTAPTPACSQELSPWYTLAQNQTNIDPGDHFSSYIYMG